MVELLHFVLYSQTNILRNLYHLFLGSSLEKKQGWSMNFALNNMSSIFTQNSGYRLKSTEEKMERIQKKESQINFLEGKKADLKNMQCNTLDEIAQKLALFNNYNDQIDAVKKQFNYEQMMHCTDEAKELGEKIAKAAEELEPKTAEERREELAKEALGIEDEGILDEMLDDLPAEELKDTLDEMLTDKEIIQEELDEELPEIVEQEKLTEMFLDRQYVPFDIKA